MLKLKMTFDLRTPTTDITLQMDDEQKRYRERESEKNRETAVEDDTMILLFLKR